MIIQSLAGVLYLLNKVFLSFSERALERGDARREYWLRISAWSVYLAGLPFWLFVFIEHDDWIAASVEAAGAPSIVIGIIVASTGNTKGQPKWLDYLAYAFIVVGIATSIARHGSFGMLSQLLETSLAAGYLIGTNLTARKFGSGYFFFMIMNVSCGALMFMQENHILAVQQFVSLLFVVDAYLAKQRIGKLARRPALPR